MEKDEIRGNLKILRQKIFFKIDRKKREKKRWFIWVRGRKIKFTTGNRYKWFWKVTNSKNCYEGWNAVHLGWKRIDFSNH